MPTYRRLFALLTLASACLLLSACFGLQFGKSSLPPPSTPLVGEARQAWDKGDMPKAESLYDRVSKLQNLPLAEQREAWERMALSAQRNNRPLRALDALDQWAKADKGADALPQWQDAWYYSALTLLPADAVKRAQGLWRDKKRSPEARAQAGIILLGRSWQPDAALAALPALRETYTRQDNARRTVLEQRGSEQFRYMAPSTLTAVNQKAAGQKPLTFPVSVLLLEQARRGTSVAGVSSAEIPALLRAPNVMADAALVNKVLGLASSTAPSNPTQSTQVGGPAPTYATVCLALALPGSGPAAPFAQKIRNGAVAAQAELGKTGATVQIQEIDTAKPDWLTQLNALPPQCAVVGGPLQAPLFTAAKAAQATTRRHFFTFLPQLEAGDEGVNAWRFFPSPQDQVAALLRFTRNELAISSYGAFYPADAYGTRMNSIFEQAVRRDGGNVQSASYPPGDMVQWATAAQPLFQPRMVGKTPFSTATFGAVFLPDSWKNMDMVTTSLLYNGDDRQVLLGTSLWEQSLSGQSHVNMNNFGLAVFPGAWNPAQVPAGLASVPTPDFWVALGYDFVRFASALNLQSYTNAATVNGRILTAQNIPWGMAPMQWDGRGQASQQLFLFTPVQNGFAPLDVIEFKNRRADILNRFENRSRDAAAAAAAAPPVPSASPAAPNAPAAAGTPHVGQ